MRIAIFTNNYLPNPYGVSGSIESFRKEFEKMGHTVYVFAPHWPNYIDANRNVFRYPSLDIKIKIRFPLPIPYSSKIEKTLEKLEVDIVHSQHPNLLGVVAAEWARKKKVPLVFTWHTLYDRYTNFVPFVPNKLAARWVIKGAVKYANKVDQVIVPTESVKKIIQAWGVSNKNIAAVPTGVDEKELEGGGGNIIRRKYQIGENETVLLSVSRLTEEKNVRFLFESMVDVLERDERVKFMHVGGGYLQEELESLIRDRGLSNRVIFIGEVKREELKNYYSAGDIFVYASKSETQGMIVSEAMYFGLPVVAVDATGICDLVENGKTGYLVEEDKEEFLEAVFGLIGDEEKRKMFSQNAKKISRENYTAEVCAKKMLEVYEKVIKNK